MKKITSSLVLALVLMALQSWASPVDESRARLIAQSFLTSGSPTLNASGSGLRLIHVEMGSSKSHQPVYYIYNTSSTFLVVAGDDRAEEILMVGDRPLKDVNNLAPGMKDLLSQYKEEIDFLHNHPALVVEKRAPRITSNEGKVYGPLLTATWDQIAPYWDRCQFDYDGATYQCYTGCPATSSAMVLHYWKYPTAQVDAIDSYSSLFFLSSSTSIDDYVYPSLPATTFDWDNMKDSYDDYSSAEGNAVATLMRYVGQAVEMMYGTEDAGGSGIYTSESQKLVDMFVRFGYDSSTCRVVFKDDYAAADWEQMIQDEMAAGRPVVYGGVTFLRQGHAFNVDGYDSSSNTYHVNFGWSGEGNSWCKMNSFAYSGYTFSRSQHAVIGIQPPAGEPLPVPELTVTPKALSFPGAVIGESYSKTFTVMGSDLDGSLTLTLDDASGNYSIDKTTITKREAADGVNVTVTFAPTEAGPSSASVTISGSGVETQVVTLDGMAVEANTIYTDATSLTFGPTYTGYATWTDITITGIVSENIELSWWYNKPGFGLSKYTITPQEAAVGAKVRVYFQPTWTSPTTNRLLISSAGTETVAIPVSGTKIKSDGYITAHPGNLSFETNVGETVTQTFRLYYSKSNGNDAVMLSGLGDDAVTVTDLGATGSGNNRIKTIIDSLRNSGGWHGDLGLGILKPILILDSIEPIVLNGLKLAITGDDGFTVPFSRVSLDVVKGGYDVTVTYMPVSAGTHDATITITLIGGTAKPQTVRLHGTATAGETSVLRGDVNASGKVDISDVTDLIDILLNNMAPNARADVNDDTQVNISDLTALIDLLLQ